MNGWEKSVSANGERVYAVYMCGFRSWHTKESIIEMANGLFPELVYDLPKSWRKHLSKESLDLLNTK